MIEKQLFEEAINHLDNIKEYLQHYQEHDEVCIPLTVDLNGMVVVMNISLMTLAGDFAREKCLILFDNFVLFFSMFILCNSLCFMTMLDQE